MAYRYSIRFSGAGTHGLIQAARILAEAAAIYDAKIATESCSYGPEARGNASRAEVIISDEAIDYPKAETIDFFIVLTQDAFDKYHKDLHPDSIIIADSSIKIDNENCKWRVFLAPFSQIAKKECSNLSLINMIALGFFAKIGDIVSNESIRQAIMARVPKKSENAYLKAYEAGLAINDKQEQV
ncbi:MAG: 2-oxoacid:acceptor oxidoreductase family protein [candidate division Zixibacteria bacterium]|nr:2-oxoacid:acceptor oxidoreductase family protein [candidate division Zixibacteria bacterium]